MSLGLSWDAAKEAVASSNPPCVSYLDAVMKYTQKFSGGDGGPMLRYLDKFAKTYGPNKKVGGEFFEALVDLKLKGSTTFPFLRTAVLATNLAGDKLVDGIARFITKSDIDKMRATKMQSNVIEIEEMLLEAWNLQSLAVEAEESQEVEALMAFGKLSIRCVLWLLGKKNPWEDLTSLGLADFKDMFQTELTGAGASGPSSSSTSKSKDAQPILAVPSFSEISNPAWVLQNEHGFATGKFFSVKNAQGIYELVRITDAALHFDEYIVDGRSNRHKIEVPTVEALAMVAKYKGALPVALPLEAVDYMAHSSNHATDEIQRAEAFVSLMRAAQEFSEANDSKLFFTIKPNEAVAQSGFKRRGLKLVPATDAASKIQLAADVWTGAIIKLQGVPFAIHPPSTPKSAKMCDWSAKAIVSAYWWVGSTHDADAANMELVAVKRGEAEIMTLTNSKPLKTGDKLLKFEEEFHGVAETANKQRRK